MDNTALQKPYSEGHGGPGLSGVIGLSWDDLVETCLGEVTCGEGPSFLGLGSEHCQVPSSLFLCRECVCLSTVSWTHRGLKGKHCYRPPPPAIFTPPCLKCDIISGCSSIHVVRANWEGKCSHCICVLSPPALRSPSSAESRWTARAGCWDRTRVKGQDAPCSLDRSRLAPTSKGLLFLLNHKAILFLSEIWFDIYIHKHIYINIFIYTVLLLH